MPTTAIGWALLVTFVAGLALALAGLLAGSSSLGVALVVVAAGLLVFDAIGVSVQAIRGLRAGRTHG